MPGQSPARWRADGSAPRESVRESACCNPSSIEPASHCRSPASGSWRKPREFCRRGGKTMPEKKTMQRVRQDKREGKSPSTQAGEFVRETMEHIRQGKHGARSTKQAIAIGLSKARRAGVKLPPPKKGQASAKTRRSAEQASRHGQGGHPHKTNPQRSRAITEALRHEGHHAASSEALGRQARQQARKRTAEERSEIARKAAKTRLAHQTPEERSVIARKAARTRLARS